MVVLPSFGFTSFKDCFDFLRVERWGFVYLQFLLESLQCVSFVFHVSRHPLEDQFFCYFAQFQQFCRKWLVDQGVWIFERLEYCFGISEDDYLAVEWGWLIKKFASSIAFRSALELSERLPMVLAFSRCSPLGHSMRMPAPPFFCSIFWWAISVDSGPSICRVLFSNDVVHFFF